MRLEYSANSGTLPDGMLIAAGAFSDVTYRTVFGFNDALSSSTEHCICDLGADFSYPAAATVVKVSSSDANDTSNGTGARTVVINGLDANWHEQSETVTLNGQTAVTTAAQFIRVFGMTVATAGNGGYNVGTIYAGTGTVTSGVPATKYAAIKPTNNASLSICYTVPAGKTAYIPVIWAQTGKNASANLTARFAVRRYGGLFVTLLKSVFYQTSLQINIKCPLVLPEKTDIEIRALASADSPDMSASYQIILVDNV